MVLEPLIVVQEHPAQWTRPKIDPKELANLRFNKGWSLNKLARHFGRAKPTICAHLNRLRAKGAKS
jgi:hypothetical protein